MNKNTLTITEIINQDLKNPASFALLELDGTNGFVISNLNAGENGSPSHRPSAIDALSSLGDINKDGIDDVIIGVDNGDPDGRGNAGEDYVIFGSNTGFESNLDLSQLEPHQGFVINGIDERDFLGISASGAGDLNGDGINDVITGASGADPNGLNLAGESYVVFGQDGGFGASFELASLNGNNGFVLEGLHPQDHLGHAVDGLGDINGDNLDDVIISASSADANGLVDAGESYVIFGSLAGFDETFDLTSLDGSNGFTIGGIDPEDRAGISVSGLGDFNGDNLNDFVIGSFGGDPNGLVDAGESYVVFGSRENFPANFDLSDLDGSNGFVINGVAPEDGLGRAISEAGDINGDGFNDLILGARRADPDGKNWAGQTYVVFGGNSFAPSLNLTDLDGSNGFVVDGMDAGDSLGFSVSGAGDLNGDSFADLILAAPHADPNGEESGEVYVIFGRNSFEASFNLGELDGSNGFLIEGIAPWNTTGFRVSDAGDLNSDGLDDVIIAANFANPDSNQVAGESYVIFGNKAPEIDLNGDAAGINYATYFPGEPVALVDPNQLALTDSNSSFLEEALVQLVNPLDGVLEELTAETNNTNITFNYDPVTGILTLTGEDTVANYQQVLATVKYNNTAPNPNLTERIIEFVVKDGGAHSNFSQVATTTLSLDTPPDGAGNNIETAREVGVLDLSLATPTFSDRVSEEDLYDYYRFDLQTTSNLELRLDGLSANANLFLLDAQGERIVGSQEEGNNPELITRSLEGGTYYALVRPDHFDGNPATDYELTFSAQFIPTDDIVSPPDFADPEFDEVENRVLWMDRQQNLWVAPVDPQTGDFILEESVQIDSGLAPFSVTRNGPEFVYTDRGTEIVYNKVIDDEFYLGHAWWTGSNWETEVIPGTQGYYTVIGTQKLDDPNPRIHFFMFGDPSQLLTKPFTLGWRDLDRQVEGIISDSVTSGINWVEGDNSALVFTSPVDNVQQTFMYDIDTDTLTQLTFSPVDKGQSTMWLDPYTNELVLIALEKKNQSDNRPSIMGVYRQIDGEWTKIKTVESPTEHKFLTSPEPFTYNGRSFVALLAKDEPTLFSEVNDVLVMGIEPDSDFVRIVNDPQYLKVHEPEVFISETGAFVYYTEYTDGVRGTTHRTDAGLGLPDGAGNTQEEARDLGVLEVYANSYNFADEVGLSVIANDKVDYYRFELETATPLAVNLDQLSANVNLFLLDASGEVISFSTNEGSNPESIAESLDPGTYFILVRSSNDDGNVASSYELSLSPPFTVNDTVVSEPGVAMPDPEFTQTDYLVTWQDRDGKLFVAPIDPKNGDFLLEQKILLDQDLPPVTFSLENGTGNGPEWVETETGAEIVYTKLIDGTWFLGNAKWNGNEWITDLLPQSEGFHAPVGTLNPDDPDPLIRYFLGTPDNKRQSIGWRELNNPDVSGLVPGAEDGLAQSSRWVEGERSLVYSLTVDDIKQVFQYDLDTDTVTQLTSDNINQTTVFMWRAPEYNNELLFFAAESESATTRATPNIGIYRNLEGVWTKINTIRPPSAKNFVRSPEPFVHNGRSFISFLMEDSNGNPSEVWVAGIDPEVPFYRQVSDPDVEMVRNDPESFVTDEGVFIYYQARPSGAIHRLDAGLGAPDGAGNTISEAKDVGILEMDSPSYNFADQVGVSIIANDVRDYYRFELLTAATVDLNLEQMNGNANMFLFDGDQNFIAGSSNTGIEPESISQGLNPGIYFVEVRSDYQDGNPFSNYELILSAQSIPENIVVSESSVQLVDPEFDRLSNSITWQDLNGSNLWVAPINPETGDFLLEEKVSIDTGLAPNNFPVAGVQNTGNGPEWIYTQNGSEIVYTKLIDGNYYIGHAWQNGNEWETEILPNSQGGHAPVGTLNEGDNTPMIRYFVGTISQRRQFVVWQELNKPEHKGEIPEATEGDIQAVRWVEGEKSLIYTATVDGVKQVFKYDVEEDTVTQLTFSPTEKITSFMWRAPEFNNELVFLTSERDLSTNTEQLEIYRKIDGNWTQINTILSSSSLGAIASPEPFVYNGRSYISLQVKNQQEDSSDIWIVGINPDFEFSRQLNDPSIWGFEPEFFQTETGAFIYYNELVTRKTYRVDTGLGLPDGAGNTLEQARDMGILEHSTSQSFADEIGISPIALDREDYYRFELLTDTVVKIELSNTTANANLFLLDASGSIVEQSEAQENTPASISYPLAPGNYYVIIEADESGGSPSTEYQLTPKGNESIMPSLALEIENPVPGIEDQFGFSVAAQGNSIVVGTPFDDVEVELVNQANVGSVSVFNKTSGELKFTLDYPNPSSGDRFGFSVAQNSNTIFVGTPFNDLDGQNVGLVYGFDVTTGELLLELRQPNPTPGSQFGMSVTTVGENVLVGAPFDDTTGGVAYLFDGVTGDLLQTITNPEPEIDDGFGRTVAARGNDLLVGAPFDGTGDDNGGSVYLFDGDTGELLFKIANPDPNEGVIDDNFGFAVAAVGNDILVGARDADDPVTGTPSTGVAYLFDGSTGELLLTLANPDPEEQESFGRSVTAVEDKIVIGSRYERTLGHQTGAVYVFDSTTGELLETIFNPEPDPRDRFGHAVVGVGGDLVVSAINEDTTANIEDAGSVYVYQLSSPEPGETPETALDLGILPTDNLQIFSDSVGLGDNSFDPRDYYRFELQNPSVLRLNLTDIDTNANLFLADENGQELARSNFPGSADESITYNLEPGTYFALVRSAPQDGNPFTDYTLTLSAQSFVPEPILITPTSFDPEFSVVGNFVTWQDRNENLLVGSVAENGDFVDIQVIDTGLAPILAPDRNEGIWTGNGPEWVYTEDTAEIVYTKLLENELGEPFWHLGRARLNQTGEWETELLEGGENRATPLGTLNVGDPNPLISYYIGTPSPDRNVRREDIAWRQLDNPDSEQIIGLNVRSGRWLPNETALITFERDADNLRQVIFYDLELEQLTPVTSSPTDKSRPIPFSAADSGELTFTVVEETKADYDDSPTVITPFRIGVYQDLDGDPNTEWDLVKEILPPSLSEDDYVADQYSPFNYQGKSYVVFMVKNKQDLDDKNASVWIASLDPNENFYREISPPGVDVPRNDPEAFVTEEGVYVYYNELTENGIRTYRVNAELDSGTEISPDMVGNSFAEAKDIGVLATPSSQTFSEWVGTTEELADIRDYYSFELQAPSLVEINLDGLDANANLFLTDQAENELARSDNGGNASEEISEVLDAGSYFVLVRSTNQDGNPFTFYDLTVAAEAVPDIAGNNLEDAYEIGTIDNNPAPHIFTDWIGGSDRRDYYSFTLSAASTVNLTLSDLAANANLFLTDEAGTELARSTNAGMESESIAMTLEAGNYSLLVRSSNSDNNPFTAYNLSLSAQFAVNEAIVSETGGNMPDPEFDPFSSRVIWQDRQERLWVADVDPLTGNFDLAGATLLDDGLAPISSFRLRTGTGNGPEPLIGLDGLTILYTKAFDTSQDTWEVYQARLTENGWQTGPLPGADSLPGNGNGLNPIGTLDPLEENPRVQYVLPSTPEEKPSWAWRDLNDSNGGIITEQAEGGARWVNGENAQVVYTEAVDDPQTPEIEQTNQVFLYDINTDTSSQLTFSSTYKDKPFMWWAPEYEENLLLVGESESSEQNTATKLGIYRQIEATWTLINEIVLPTEKAFIRSAEPVVFNGNSYISMLAEDDKQQPSEVWITAATPEAELYRQVSDPNISLVRNDPEPVVTEGGLFIYYTERGSGVVYRADTGLGLPESLTLTGTLENDQLLGDAGADIITGSDGNDILRGAAGNDAIEGGAGNDQIIGDVGDDTLTGAGNGDLGLNTEDILTGGKGVDTFVLGTSTEGIFYDGNGDGDFARILDFTIGEDFLQVKGSSGDYTATNRAGGAVILLTSDNEEIAFLEDIQAGDLTGDDFVFV